MPMLARVGQRGWWPPGRAGLWYAVIVAALTVLAVFDLAQHYDIAGGVGVPQAVALARLAPLLLAWARPVAAAGLSLGAVAVTAVTTTPVTPAEPWPWAVSSVAGHAAVLIALGARTSGPVARRALLGGFWAASQVLGLIAVAAAPDHGDFIGLIAPAVLLGLAVIGGELAGARAQLTRVVDEQRTDIEGERERRARLEERTRVARELHDVVAHHLSVVVARADSAPARLPELAEPVRGELAAIADEARESLTEMRRVLRLLRDGEGGGSGDSAGQPRQPQPGLADLPALIDGTRATGATVALARPLPDGAGVPATAQLTAYRVVQEALTNAIRHASGAPITVLVAHRGGRLEVVVTNPAPGPAAPGRGGHGLRGITERVAAAGGTARAERSGSTFAVRASIPAGPP
jgi:signal transduction histidine kinase